MTLPFGKTILEIKTHEFVKTTRQGQNDLAARARFYAAATLTRHARLADCVSLIIVEADGTVSPIEVPIVLQPGVAR
jgi:hypothetical protein